MTPHQVLELDPGETDPRQIKRAYARLVRQHRPDEDPVGFRRVRDAYEWLIAVTAGRRTAGVELQVPMPGCEETAAAAGSTPSPVDASDRDEPPAQPRRPGPSAIGAEPFSPPSPAPAEVVDLERDLTAGAIDVSTWSAAVGQRCEAHPERYDDLDPEHLLLELDAGLDRVALGALRAWDAGEAFERIRAFGQRWSTEADRSCYLAAGSLCLRLAYLLAFIDHALAVALRESAFGLMSARERGGWNEHQTDLQLEMGRQARDQPANVRRYYRRLVTTGEWDGDTASSDARATLENLSWHAADSALRTCLEQQVPAFVEAARHHGGTVLRATGGRGRRAIEDDGSGFSPWWLTWILVFVVFQFGRCAWYDDRPHRPYVHPQPAGDGWRSGGPLHEGLPRMSQEELRQIIERADRRSRERLEQHDSLYRGDPQPPVAPVDREGNATPEPAPVP